MQKALAGKKMTMWEEARWKVKLGIPASQPLYLPVHGSGYGQQTDSSSSRQPGISQGDRAQLQPGNSRAGLPDGMYAATSAAGGTPAGATAGYAQQQPTATDGGRSRPDGQALGQGMRGSGSQGMLAERRMDVMQQEHQRWESTRQLMKQLKAQLDKMSENLPQQLPGHSAGSGQQVHSSSSRQPGNSQMLQQGKPLPCTSRLGLRPPDAGMHAGNPGCTLPQGVVQQQLPILQQQMHRMPQLREQQGHPAGVTPPGPMWQQPQQISGGQQQVAGDTAGAAWFDFDDEDLQGGRHFSMGSHAAGDVSTCVCMCCGAIVCRRGIVGAQQADKLCWVCMHCYQANWPGRFFSDQAMHCSPWHVMQCCCSLHPCAELIFCDDMCDAQVLGHWQLVCHLSMVHHRMGHSKQHTSVT